MFDMFMVIFSYDHPHLHYLTDMLRLETATTYVCTYLRMYV